MFCSNEHWVLLIIVEKGLAKVTGKNKGLSADLHSPWNRYDRRSFGFTLSKRLDTSSPLDHLLSCNHLIRKCRLPLFTYKWCQPEMKEISTLWSRMRAFKVCLDRWQTSLDLECIEESRHELYSPNDHMPDTRPEFSRFEATLQHHLHFMSLFRSSRTSLPCLRSYKNCASSL
jgi:hypothetical protein